MLLFRSAKLTGPFVQMIYSMIAGDMIRFAIISAIFLVSFSQGCFLLTEYPTEGFTNRNKNTIRTKEILKKEIEFVNKLK